MMNVSLYLLDVCVRACVGHRFEPWQLAIKWMWDTTKMISAYVDDGRGRAASYFVW
jgi:hypothetical protein